MADISFIDIPASTQVLHNSDLLHCVLSFVPLEWECQHRDLPRYAIVCRAFYEPAIRILWRTLRDLLPLWHLLAPQDAPFPPDKLSTTAGTKLEYLRKVSAAKLYNDPIRWDRFLWHASLVRNLCCTLSPKEKEAHLALILAVLAKNGGNTFLPLLRSLNWSEEIMAILRDTSLSPLFTPALRIASIAFGRSSHPENVRSLRRLRESSPFLESITLSTNIGIDLSLVQELAAFNHLREIRLPSLTSPEAFRILSVRSNLASLSLHAAGRPWTGLIPRISAHHLFELDVLGTSQSLTSFLGPIYFDVLRTAHLSFMHTEMHSRITDITPVLEVFRSAVSPGSLQSLTVNWLAVSQNQVPLRDVLAPVLSLSAITSFRFCSLVHIVQQDDEDVKALVHAWPRLERLLLYNGLIPPCDMSIAAVHDLYTYCPNLREVSLPWLQCPAIGVHTLLELRPDHAPHPLRSLFIGEVSIPPTTVEGVGEGLLRYLFDLFPRLDHRAVQTRLGPFRIPADDVWVA